jgi:hypothetical protein
MAVGAGMIRAPAVARRRQGSAWTWAIGLYHGSRGGNLIQSITTATQHMGCACGAPDEAHTFMLGLPAEGISLLHPTLSL